MDNSESPLIESELSDRGRSASRGRGAAAAPSGDIICAAKVGSRARVLVALRFKDRIFERRYHERLRRDEGARLVRLRWYGDGNRDAASTAVYVERKVHHEAWTNEPSVKARFGPLRGTEVLDAVAWDEAAATAKAKVLDDVATGSPEEENPEAGVRAADDAPASSEFLRRASDLGRRLSGWSRPKPAPRRHGTLQAEVAGLVADRGLVPTARSVYWRAAFQRPDSNDVRVSLDCSLCFLDETSAGANATAYPRPSGSVSVLRERSRRGYGRGHRRGMPRGNLPRDDATLQKPSNGRVFRLFELSMSRARRYSGTRATIFEEEIDARRRRAGEANDAPAGAHRFGFAVLEVKLSKGAPPPWLDDVLSTFADRLVEVHKFSKYLTACAALRVKGVALLPHWFRVDGKPPDDLGDFPKNTQCAPTPAPITPSEIPRTLVSPAKVAPLPGGGPARVDSEDAVLAAPPRYAPVRVEPKVYFANERTFIQWMGVAILLVTLSLALVSFGTETAFATGLVCAPVALVVLWYALWLYIWRARQISTKSNASRVRRAERPL